MIFKFSPTERSGYKGYTAVVIVNADEGIKLHIRNRKMVERILLFNVDALDMLTKICNGGSKRSSLKQPERARLRLFIEKARSCVFSDEDSVVGLRALLEGVKENGGGG